MKLHFLLMSAAGLLVLGGCSSTPTKVDAGPIAARTFSFIQGKPTPEFAEQRDAIHPMIQGAIAKNLTARGLSQVPSGGDVTVAYLIIVGNNATTESINEYFGYRPDATALHDKAHDRYTSTGNPSYFEKGTLVIDLIDAKSFKLLKRGYATRDLLRSLPVDARGQRVQEVVDEILRNVRVKQ